MWYIKNWILSGAPFIPFTTGLNWTAENVHLYLSTIQKPSISLLLNVITPFLSLTTDALKFGELTWIGPIFLAFISLPILLQNSKKIINPLGAILLFSIIYYMIWLFFFPQSRLLLPVLVILTIFIAQVIKDNKFYKTMVLISILSALPFALLYNGASYGKSFEGSATWDMYDDFKLQHMLGYKLNSTILVYGDVHTYYLDYDYVWARPDMQGWITDYSNLSKYGITHVLIAQEDPFPEIKKQILKNNLIPIYYRVRYNYSAVVYEVR